MPRGGPGQKRTPEQRARISAARKAAGNEALRGRKRPPEVGAKISAAMKGRKRPDISERQRGVPKSDKHREALRAASLARVIPGARRVAARDGDVRQANDRVHTLIRRGFLPHPKTLPCTDCGQVWMPGLSRHEYDHYLGYAAEHHETVQPVCSKCHHAREKARGRCRQQEKPFSRCAVCDKELTHRRGGRCAACYRARLPIPTEVDRSEAA